MARTETIEIFTFEELSDAAKEKARQWWRGGDYRQEYDWEQEAYTAIQKFCEAFSERRRPVRR